MVHAKPKGVFEHVQIAQIQIDIAHVQSLIRAFALHWYILQCQMIMLADSEGPDQTARMHSLIWAFAVRICPRAFSHGAAHIILTSKRSHKPGVI